MSTARISMMATLLLILAGATPTRGSDSVDGFTEPWQRLQVAALESGLIDTMDVEEGTVVTKGQAIAQLDRDLQRANLEVARKSMEAKGQQAEARAELQVAALRLEKLKTLLSRQSASTEEVEKAERDRDIAAARLQIAEEAAAVSAAEFERARIQLERRTVRSPTDGIVTDIRRHLGEYVLPSDPTVMTIVQLNPLRATFSIPASRVGKLAAGKTVLIRLTSSAAPVTGSIEFVSPVTTAQSGTVTVKVRVPNPDHRYRAGEKCELQLGEAPSQVTGVEQPGTR